MSESLDPEVVAELMNTLWTQLDRVVVEHGGRVDKHIGDALIAVWGVEVTAEDDAERACVQLLSCSPNSSSSGSRLAGISRSASVSTLARRWLVLDRNTGGLKARTKATPTRVLEENPVAVQVIGRGILIKPEFVSSNAQFVKNI